MNNSEREWREIGKTLVRVRHVLVKKFWASSREHFAAPDARQPWYWRFQSEITAIATMRVRKRPS